MFLLRWAKNLIILVLLIVGVWALMHYNYKGRPVKQHVQEFLKSEMYQEGIKDIRMLVGGFLETVGEEIQEDVREGDKKKLDRVVQEKINQGEKKNDF